MKTDANARSTCGAPTLNAYMSVSDGGSPRGRSAILDSHDTGRVLTRSCRGGEGGRSMDDFMLEAPSPSVDPFLKWVGGKRQLLTELRRSLFSG